MKRFSFKNMWGILKQAFSGFSDDKVTKLSASLAYYTVFSIGPLMVVIISLCSIFLGREAVEGSLFGQIRGFVGAEAAEQIQTIIKSASLNGKGTVAFIIGIVTLLIGATTVFGEIQDSINSIWGLKPKPKQGILKLLLNRLLSFGIIGSLGFLLLVSFGVTAIIEGVGNRLKTIFPDVAVVLLYIVNLVVTLGVVTMIFAVIFKVLPDAKIKWKDVWAGAIATAILFMIGRFGISFYIGQSKVGTTYGAAGSFVILLLWVYYSAIIVYFGAEFTKAYALKFGDEIHPNSYAVTTTQVEVEVGKTSIQQADKKVNEIQDKKSLEAAVAASKQPEPEPVGPVATVVRERHLSQHEKIQELTREMKSFDLLQAVFSVALSKMMGSSKSKKMREG